MKSFANIQELWEFCELCPMCQKQSRTIHISAGPEHIWDVVRFSYQNDSIIIFCTYKYKQKRYFVDLKLSNLEKTFDLKFRSKSFAPLKEEIILHLKETDLCFDIQSDCKNCQYSTAASESIELDIKNGKFGSLRLEREKFLLEREKDKYLVTFWHGDNTMRVAKWNSQTFEEGKEIKLPLTTLDLTNQAKVIDKLKTYILFS
jgi:hypothetical protein